MPSPQDERIARIIRLEAQRRNILFALIHAELSDAQKTQLEAQLADVQDELAQLTGGLSLN